MKENEIQIKDADSQKARIRERYKGVDLDELDIIPALPQENFYENTNEKRVAVYARVSTDDPRQTSSYELQKNHYKDVVSRHPGWNLTEIYADEGISGTSLQHRDAFIKMINDCQEGKIDLIVTKTVARFARNILDCIGHVRQLAGMQPPVGVFFETENIYTLNSNSEMLLSFMATMAQEESHNKSEIMNSSIEMRFRRGIFLTPPLLGYDQDDDGNLVINEDEAETVRLVFFMYLYGYTCMQIAETLTKLGRRSKKNNTTWSPGSILQILQNERHCGEVLARKT
jgi:DNA invertase Pin-like site-specific DNA recombinase